MSKLRRGKRSEGVRKMKESSKGYPMIYHMTGSENVRKVPPEAIKFVIVGGRTDIRRYPTVQVTILVKFSRKSEIRGYRYSDNSV